MAIIPTYSDPTLDALDSAFVAQHAKTEKQRDYLGASGIGDPCNRKIWYQYNAVTKQQFDAATLRRFSDGHRTEDLIVSWFRLLPFIELHIHDENGKQYGFKDGKFQGNYDGIIKGLIQAPTKYHIFEVKAVNEKKFNELKKLILQHGEKRALQKWDENYYAQAVTYMAHAGIDRHYLVCATPGGRDLTSIRTNADPEYAARLSDKAHKIIETKITPPRISDKPDFWLCRFCNFHKVCHG